MNRVEFREASDNWISLKIISSEGKELVHLNLLKVQMVFMPSHNWKTGVYCVDGIASCTCKFRVNENMQFVVSVSPREPDMIYEIDVTQMLYEVEVFKLLGG